MDLTKNKIRAFISMVFLWGCFSWALAQSNSMVAFPEETIFETLDTGLIQGDTLTLKHLTHKKISMGHSNGWVQDQEDLILTAITKKVEYLKMEALDPPVICFKSPAITVTRRKIHVTGIVGKKTFDLKLEVLENWILDNQQWQLLSRQSVEIKE